MQFAHFWHLDWKNTYVLYNFTFRSCFFFLILLQNTLFLQQIHTFGASRAGETLTCAKMLLFTTFQVPFFSRRRRWGDLKCDTVVKLIFSKTFSLSTQNQFGTSISLWSSRSLSGSLVYEQILCFT
jgi:hypothetical protein